MYSWYTPCQFCVANNIVPIKTAIEGALDFKYPKKSAGIPFFLAWTVKYPDGIGKKYLADLAANLQKAGIKMELNPFIW